MINSDFYLILLLISLAAAPLVHLIIAYYIAPKRAKAEYWLKGKQGKMAQEMTTTDLMKIARKYKKNESQDSLDIFSREGDLEPDDRIKEGKVILPFQGRFRDRSEEKLDPLLYRLRNS